MVTFMQPCLVEEPCLVTLKSEYWKCDPVGGLMMMLVIRVRRTCTDTCRECCTIGDLCSSFVLRKMEVALRTTLHIPLRQCYTQHTTSEYSPFQSILTSSNTFINSPCTHRTIDPNIRHLMTVLTRFGDQIEYPPAGGCGKDGR